MSCNPDVINIASGVEPPVYLWQSPGCAGTPITINQSGVYQDIKDVMAVSPFLTYLGQNKGIPGLTDGILQTKSVYVPPHLEIDWSAIQNMAIDQCDQTGCYNQGTFEWPGVGAGFYPNLYQNAGSLLSKQGGRPIDDNQGLGIYTNRVRSIKVRQHDVWDKFKINCCRGRGNQQACSVFWGPGTDGVCDSIMADWCHWNYDNPDCACMTSEIANAQCWDNACASSATAYRTQNQKRVYQQGCPVQLTCTQVLNLSDGARNNLLDGVTMFQKCNTPPPSSIPSASNPVSPTDDDGVIDVSTNIDTSGGWPDGFPPEDDPRWHLLPIPEELTSQNTNKQRIMVYIIIIVAVLFMAAQITFLTEPVQQTYQQYYTQ